MYDCTVRGTEYCTITLINKLTPSFESAAPLLLSPPLSSLLRAAPPRRLGRLILRMEAERVRAIRAGAPLAAIIPTAWRQRGGARRLGVRRFARRGRSGGLVPPNCAMVKTGFAWTYFRCNLFAYCFVLVELQILQQRATYISIVFHEDPF